jgi:predicted nucleic acid-binding protein
MRKGKVFIDANILIHAATFKSADVFSWIDSLYNEIYIHQVVLEELLKSEVRKPVEDYIAQGKWKLFNPDDEKALTDDDFTIYQSYLRDMHQTFTNLNNKKKEQNRPLKHTNDLGEIHSLAAALLLGASIICSNDYDIGEVIQDTPIFVTMDEAHPNKVIEQDTLVDFCYYTIKEDSTKSRDVRKFLKLIDSKKMSELDRLLSPRL